MPNVGDLVVNMMMDASQYRKENELSRESNNALGGSLDVIQGKLERQKRELQNRGKTTQDNILGAAAKGASEGEVSAALQLNDEVNALRARKQAEEAAIVARQESIRVGQELTTGLSVEISLFGKTADEVQLYRAAMAGASEADLRLAQEKQELLATMRAEKAEADAVAAEIARGLQVGERLVANLTERRMAIGATADELELYRAASAGASASDLQLAQEIQADIIAMKAEAAAAAAATAEIARSKQVGEALVTNLTERRMAISATADELELYRAAIAGASAADLQLAQEIQADIAAMKAEAAAEAEATAEIARAKQVGESLVANLIERRIELGATADELELYRAASAGASAADIELAKEIQDDIAAMKAEKKAADDIVKSKERADQAGKNLVDTLTREQKTYGMTTAEIRQYEAAQAGASAEDRKAAAEIQWKIDQQQRHDREIEKQINSQRRANEENTKGSRSQRGLTEAMRGTEDAIAGFTNNGIKGMIQATSNNIGQLGDIVGGNAGMYLQVGSIVALAAVSAIPMIDNWINENKKLEESIEKVKEAAEKQYQAELKQIEARHARGNSTRRKDEENEDLRLAGDTTADQLRAEEKKIKRDIRDSNEEAAMLREKQAKIASRISGLQDENKTTFTTADEIKARNEQIDKLQEEEAEIVKRRQQAAIAERQARLRLELTEEERIRQEFREEGERQAKQEIEDEAAMAKQATEQLAREKKKLSDEVASQKSFSQSISQNINSILPGEAERQARIKREIEIEKAQKSGLINDQEAGLLNELNSKKPEAAAGNAAAIQAGSKEAYSAILRGMKQAETAKAMAEQKKVAEESKSLLERIEKNTAEKEARILVDF